MSGHSKWSTIKHKKGAADAKKGQIFSKLSKVIALAAREKGGDPAMNAQLRMVIEKAKEAEMPKDNIERAIQRGLGKTDGTKIEELTLEGYGPGGVALIIETITDNKNRTVPEIRHLLENFGGKLGSEGSAKWAFERKLNKEGSFEWLPKMPIKLEDAAINSTLEKLYEALDGQDDVQEIYSNTL